MSHKDKAAAQTAPGKGNPDDKSEAVPGAEKPATQPEKAPAKVAPVKKS